jgi:hypothetical protein
MNEQKTPPTELLLFRLGTTESPADKNATRVK